MSINEPRNNPEHQEKLEPIHKEYDIDPRALIATFRITKNALKKQIAKFESLSSGGLSKEHQTAVKAIRLLAKDFEQNLGFLLHEPGLITQNTEHRLNQYPDRLKNVGAITPTQDVVFKYISSHIEDEETWWQEDLEIADEALTFLLVQTETLFEIQHKIPPNAKDILLKSIENLPRPTLAQMNKRYPELAP